MTAFDLLTDWAGGIILAVVATVAYATYRHQHALQNRSK